MLDRAQRTFSNLNACQTNPTRQKIEKELAPKLAAHRDEIFLNPKLFARVQALYEQRDKLGLSPDSAYLLERYYKDFVRAGARLSDADKEKLKQINGELAKLQTDFEQNVLKERNASSVVVDKKEELAGLTDDQMKSVINAAKAEKKEGNFVIQLQNTTGQPLLGSLQNRPLRERLMQASLARNSKGGEFDTRNIVLRTVQLRAEKAKLLGYDNWAAYQLEEQTAHNVATVNKLLADLAPPAVANAKREAAEQQKIVDQEKGGFQIAACDWDLYSEKVRKAKYNFDESEVRPYYELNHVIVDGVFFAANKEYGLTFKERHDLPVYRAGRASLGSVRSRWKAARDFHRRLLRASIEARRRLDECLCPAKRSVRDETGCGESPQHSKAAARGTDTAYSRSSADRVSRIRARAARHVFKREISAIQWNECAARFCRVSVAGKRDVGHVAGGPRQLRESITRPGNQYRRRCSTRSKPRKNSIRDLRPLNTCRPRYSTRRGIS